MTRTTVLLFTHTCFRQYVNRIIDKCLRNSVIIRRFKFLTRKRMGVHNENRTNSFRRIDIRVRVLFSRRCTNRTSDTRFLKFYYPFPQSFLMRTRRKGGGRFGKLADTINCQLVRFTKRL